jgi:hypothetical protein
MSNETGFRFLCPGCGASFGWKPQYAGRKIRCKCGQVFMPPDPAAAQDSAPAEPDPYDVNDDAAAPAPRPAAAHRAPPMRPAAAAPAHAPMQAPMHPTMDPTAHAAAPVPPAAPAAAPPAHAEARTSLSGVAALYPARRAKVMTEEADAAVEGSPLKDLYIPIALLVLGLGLRVAQLLVANESRANKWGGDVQTPDDPRKVVLMAVFQMIISGGVMIAGATLAATVLNLNLGSLGKAALKLCAIAVFATGVASWVAIFDQDKYSVTGLMVALHIVVIIYWVGFFYLFALDLQETMLAVAIIALLHAAATCALWKGDL